MYFTRAVIFSSSIHLDRFDTFGYKNSFFAHEPGTEPFNHLQCTDGRKYIKTQCRMEMFRLASKSVQKCFQQSKWGLNQQNKLIQCMERNLWNVLKKNSI